MAKKATNTENSGSLRDRLLKTSTIKETSILGDSKIFQPQTFYDTGIPLINLALSTEVDKGLFPGITIIAGPSKHFKSKFALELLSGFLKNSDKGIGLIYDNEFGSPAKYFESSSIDTDRVIYSPIMNLEELKFDLVKQLEHITKEDEVCILIDSIGNLASKKELDDALDGESKQDMTRAKVLKSIFRMITPYVKMKNIPLIGIGHTYQTQEMYSRSVVSGGTGGYYSADNIWIVGRQQRKEGNEVEGYDYIINVEKSRFVKEKTKFPITVTFDGGIDKWSGMLELAVELGYIGKAGKSTYQVIDRETGELIGKEYKKDELSNNDNFWNPMMTDSFKKALKEYCSL
jgi:hypothetical protein